MKEVIVITGGAGGMGLATAKACGRMGYRIVLCDIDRDVLDAARAALVKEGVDVDAVQSDITDIASLAEVVKVGACNIFCVNG